MVGKMKIGVYDLGYERVELFAREGSGGNFEAVPKDSHLPVIEIGMDEEDFGIMFAVLAHEALEFSATRHQVRYTLTGSVAKDNGEYTFVIPHTIFSDVVACASEFLLASQKPLQQAWTKWKKEHKDGNKG